jgi:hypothetical protein
MLLKGMEYIVLLLILIILIILLMYVIFNKKSDDTVTDTVSDTVSDKNINAKIVPSSIKNLSRFKIITPFNDSKIESYKIESYKIEYNEGKTIVSNEELSENVFVKLKWDNTTGFDNITKIDFERYVNDELKHTITKNIKNNEDIDYFIDNKKDLQIIFDNKNSDGLYNVIGENKIMFKIFYKDKDGKETPVILYDGGDTIDISSDDLSMSYDITEPITYEYKPGTANFRLEEPDIKRYSYYIYSNDDDNNSITEYISSGNKDRILFISFENSTSDFFMKLDSGQWVVRDDTNSLKLSDQNTNSVFTLVKSPKATVSAKYVRIKYNDRFLVKSGSSMKFLTMSEMNKDEYDNIDLLITEQMRV